MAGVIRLDSQEQLVVRLWSADPAPGLQVQALGPVCVSSFSQMETWAPATTSQMEPVQSRDLVLYAVKFTHAVDVIFSLSTLMMI